MLLKHQVSRYSIWHNGFFFLLFFNVRWLFERQVLFFDFQAIRHFFLLGTQYAEVSKVTLCLNFAIFIPVLVQTGKEAKMKEFLSLIPLLLWLGSKHHRVNFPRRLFITFEHGNVSTFLTCSVWKPTGKQNISVVFDS